MQQLWAACSYFSTAKLQPNARSHKFLGYSAWLCDEWKTIWDERQKCDECFTEIIDY